MERMEQNAGPGKVPGMFLLKSLLFSYILTAALLAVLAFVLFRLRLNERTVSIAIIVIYIAATFRKFDT